MSVTLVRAGAELLTVGVGQGCRPHRISLYTNVFLKLHVNSAYTMEMLYWVYQLFGDNSPLGKLVVNPGSPWQSTDAKSIIGRERLWDSQVSTMYADIQIQVSQHLRVLSSQASKQQACSCAVKERCLAWWCRLAARLESPALQNTPDWGAHVCPLPGSRGEVAWVMQISALLLPHLHQVRPMNAQSALTYAASLWN